MLLLRFCSATILLFSVFESKSQRQMEYLDRGVIAVRNADRKVFVSWRLLGTEPTNVAFNVYRANGNMKNGSDKTIKLNKGAITKTTSYIDATANPDVTYSYYVTTIKNGKEDKKVKDKNYFVLQPGNNPYFSIPLQTPAGYAPNDGSVGDLDGDGEYEILLHQTGRGRDNSQAGITDPPVFQAYKLDGTLLWTINLGKKYS